MNKVVLQEDIDYLKGLIKVNLSELNDVNVVNKKDKQPLAYSEASGKFITVDWVEIGDAMGVSLKQVNKTGIVGSTTMPYIVSIPINTLDFKVPKVNVLKFVLGTQNIVSVINTFLSSESTGFQADSMLTFDGRVKLNTTANSNMVKDGEINNYGVYTTSFNPNDFNTLSQIAINDDGMNRSLSRTGVPNNRLIIPTSDIDLSNASNIDFFKLTATSGITGVRVVCSVDGGKAWKTYDGNNWININLTVSELYTKGIDVTSFNAITSAFWNLLTSTHKIRFAYLIQPSNTIDDLSIQYDGLGSWVECKDTSYDVVYGSNSLLQIKLYFSGDVKINY